MYSNQSAALRYCNRGLGCKLCLVNMGIVSPEECLGCNGMTPCNYDYSPDTYNKDGTKKESVVTPP